MTAFVECGVCGAKLFFDTGRPIHPESEGWIEIPVCEVSVKARTEGRGETKPVCPECLKFRAKMAEIYDPFGGKGR